MLDKKVCLKCTIRLKYLNNIDFSNIWEYANILYCPKKLNPFTKIPIPIDNKSEPPLECPFKNLHNKPKHITLQNKLPVYKGKHIEINWNPFK